MITASNASGALGLLQRRLQDYVGGTQAMWDIAFGIVIAVFILLFFLLIGAFIHTIERAVKNREKR